MNHTRTIPVPGEFYRHFKNRMYQIVSIAYHSETQEPMVVYQALYGDYKIWVRPLDMFLEEVDRNKYPDVTQKYRFEKVRPDVQHDGNGKKTEPSGVFAGAENFAEDLNRETEPEMNPHLLEFFDAMDEKRYDKMLEALAKMSGRATQKEIDDICMVLDMHTVGVSVNEQIADIRRHIHMLRKFDGERLR